MTNNFNQNWNSHYDFSNLQNILEIEKVETYCLSDDHKIYVAEEHIESPWGSNKVAQIWSENGAEYCQKNIAINPGYMLSLQRHRGREETWIVRKGILTVICDGERHDVPQGQKIFIPKGSSHCMINISQHAVDVEEIQKGICREADNIRLLDFSGRPTYPLTTQLEYQSALLYRDVMRSITL